jgi:hypothetical protein
MKKLECMDNADTVAIDCFKKQFSFCNRLLISNGFNYKLLYVFPFVRIIVINLVAEYSYC